MFTGHHFGVFQTLQWSKHTIYYTLTWATLATLLYEALGLTFLGIPTLPMSLVGVAVAFYLGFKNNASYERTWEARKIWGAIVNASRSWGYSIRDLVSDEHGGTIEPEQLDETRAALIHRHIAWMDALRFQLRKLKSWEHSSPEFMEYRKHFHVPEFCEKLEEVLEKNLNEEELTAITAMINPAAHLLANQSAALAKLRRDGLLDGFAHMELQKLLQELMAQQGKAERIKNFPFPRQYATVNSIFATLFAALLPFALLPEFAKLGPYMVWLTIPFSVMVSWVFLTTDQIGEWSENPFEGLANDVPISSMARGIERDMLQIIGETELPPTRSDNGTQIIY